MHLPPARCARSSLYHVRAGQVGEDPARLPGRQISQEAAAAVEISGPGLAGSSRNTARGISSSLR